MHNSIFTAIVELSEQYEGQELLEKVNAVVPEVFTLLEERETEIFSHDWKATILYIAYMYSLDSNMQVLGTDHTSRKKIIAGRVDLPIMHHGRLLALKSNNCKSIILAYLDQQIDRDWRHLMRTKDLYEQLSDMQLSEMTTEDGKVDYKLVVDSSKQLTAWHKEIESLEKAVRAKYKAILPLFEEVMADKGSKELSLRIENSEFIK